MKGSPTLDAAALNRATLARQLMLERSSMSPYEAIGHLVGLQAQTATTWYLTLWSRLRDFDPEATGQLLTDRRIVRSWFMRATIHLVTDADAPGLRAFTQPPIERAIRGKWGDALAGVDLREMATAIRGLTSDTPRTPAELVRLLAERWPGPDALTMSNAAKAIVPLVQAPPRGVWGRSGAVRLTPLDGWLGRSVPGTTDPEPFVLRYLAAYGPASVMDAQAWSGVTRLGEVFERLRPRLLTFRGEDGRELFDLPDSPRPDPDTPAPVRFLADFDNILLSHADRSRFGDDGAREALTYREGPYPGYLLVDGRAAADWHATVQDSTVTATIRTIAQRLAPDDEAAVSEEADALLRFQYPAAMHRVVEIRPIRIE